MHAIFRRAVKLYGLRSNSVANVDRFRLRSCQAEAAIFLTVAFTGLRRGEVPGIAVARSRL